MRPATGRKRRPNRFFAFALMLAATLGSFAVMIFLIAGGAESPWKQQRCCEMKMEVKP